MLQQHLPENKSISLGIPSLCVGTVYNFLLNTPFFHCLCILKGNYKLLHDSAFTSDLCISLLILLLGRGVQGELKGFLFSSLCELTGTLWKASCQIKFSALLLFEFFHHLVGSFQLIPSTVWCICVGQIYTLLLQVSLYFKHKVSGEVGTVDLGSHPWNKETEAGK